jgi:large subunit ribosomal protein L20
MTRVKRGVIKNKRRKNILSQTKGYRFGRSTKEAQAKEAIAHAGTYAFAHRRDKKGDARRLWQVRINAAVRELGMSYSKFIGGLKTAGITVDRKILSDIAASHPETFKRVFDKIK